MFEDTISGQTGGNQDQNKVLILMAVVIVALYAFDSCSCSTPSFILTVYRFIKSYVYPEVKQLDADLKAQSDKIVKDLQA